MQLQPRTEANVMPDDEIPPDLARAGAVVDKAIEFLVDENIAALSIASALLGGALGLLARSFDDGAIVQILNNAIAGVLAGDLQRPEAAPATAPLPLFHTSRRG